ncbi:peptide chain release factor N(5)-glutamine methyltransferase [Candidatus Nomurabacteria bacterium]|nr:peptide chain release factor N(5)-glutamine methyltransferase [Candidatus Nomurabacteria bacterium]
MKTIVLLLYGVKWCARMGDMTQGEWIANATKALLKCAITTARLDALVLMSYVTKQDKAAILAHPETALSSADIATLATALKRRCNHEPIAYIMGTKEFYGRNFLVTPNVLIPRPESEDFINLLKHYPPTKGHKLIDIGTGSGILAISAKKEFPALSVYVTDVSKAALRVAATNAKNHAVTIQCIQSNLLHTVPGCFDYIFANLPYVPKDYSVSAEVLSEPQRAIFADKNGLALIFRLADQAKKSLTKDGLIFVESLIEQQEEICDHYQKAGLTAIDNAGFIQVFKKSVMS